MYIQNILDDIINKKFSYKQVSTSKIVSYNLKVRYYRFYNVSEMLSTDYHTFCIKNEVLCFLADDAGDVAFTEIEFPISTDSDEWFNFQVLHDYSFEDAQKIIKCFEILRVEFDKIVEF